MIISIKLIDCLHRKYLKFVFSNAAAAFFRSVEIFSLNSYILKIYLLICKHGTHEKRHCPERSIFTLVISICLVLQNPTLFCLDIYLSPKMSKFSKKKVLKCFGSKESFNFAYMNDKVSRWVTYIYNWPTQPTKIKHPRYNICMYWTNFCQPTVRVV